VRARAKDLPRANWSCDKCNSQALVTLGREVCCMGCHDPVPKDHPLQMELDAEWKKADERAKEETQKRLAAFEADQRRYKEEQRRNAEALEKVGVVLSFLHGELADAKTYRVTPVLDFPAAAADEVTAIKNRRLANQWLEEFHATDDYRQVVQLKAQCVESRKEAQNIELEIAKLEEEHRASLARGGEVAKVGGNLGAARSKLSVLKSRVQTLASLSADAEKAARQKYGEFIALKKRAALVETQAVFEKLSTEWRTRMREGLLELVAVHQTLASMTTTYGPFQAEIAKPLTFPG